MSKVIVTFEKNWRGYAAGETAGFDAAVAEGLIAGGYAAEAGKAVKSTPSSKPAPAKGGGKGGAAATGDNAETQQGGQADNSGKP